MKRNFDKQTEVINEDRADSEGIGESITIPISNPMSRASKEFLPQNDSYMNHNPTDSFL